MTGQEIINLIEEGNLHDKHFFIDVEGYLSPIEAVLENDHEDVILAQEGRNANDWCDDVNNLERYFSEWFNIISYDEAKELWDKKNKNFYVLRKDGTDSSAENFETWEELTLDFPELVFGKERK